MNKRTGLTKKVLFIFFVAAQAVALRAQTNFAAAVEALLPTNRCYVDIMDLSYPKRFQDLAMKFQAAAAANKEWWLNYVKENSTPGQPLPYNEKFGLTKEEYDEFLTLGEHRTLQKVGSGSINVKVRSQVYELEGGATIPSLRKIKIDFTDLAVSTPYGVLKNPESVEESSNAPALGAYSGYRWHLEEADIDNGNIRTASFLIGKLKASGRCFIYYKGALTRTNTPIVDSHVVIYYDLK